MKKRTLWKIVAAFCLIAMLLPTFSGLTFTPVVAEDSSTSPAPVPYALEFLNQEHPKMYLSDAATTLDGVKNDSENYYLLTEKTDGDGNANGIFSAELNPTSINDVASEARPKYLRIYGNYNEDGMNFFIEAKSRTHTKNPYNQGLIKVKFGTNFGNTAADAKTTFSVTYQFSSKDPNASELSGTKSDTSYIMKRVDNAETITDSTGTYGLTESVYEFTVPWSAIGVTELDENTLNRVNFRVDYFYETAKAGDFNYWFYGVPYNASMIQKTPTTLDALFSANYGEDLFTAQMVFPHVLELSGQKPAATYNNAPAVTAQSEMNKNGDNYTVAFDYKLTADAQVAEAGVLYGNTVDIKGKNLIWSETADKHTFTLTSGAATFTHNFAATAYDTFVSFRPYVKYTDGTIIYGDYATTSPNYMANSSFTFERELNVLMIGCSFNYYYLDELVSMAAADGIKLNAHKAYYSGNPANSTWNWLIHDGAYWQEFRHSYDKPAGTSLNDRTLKQILEGGPEKLTWDFISVQDHYGPGTSKSYELCVEKSLPYLANTFRYLEATEPQATLLLHETWSYDKDHGDMKKISATAETVNEHQANISNTIYKMSETIPASGTIGNYKGMPIVPSGAAWSYARNGVTIDGTEYKIPASSTGILTKDWFHDGETPGGQFMNACVWYEVLTGNSCIGNTWRPAYALDEDRALALQQIAHKAVADLYGEDFATNVPDVRE